MTNPNLAFEFLTGRAPAPTWRRRAARIHRPGRLIAWLRGLTASAQPRGSGRN